LTLEGQTLNLGRTPLVPGICLKYAVGAERRKPLWQQKGLFFAYPLGQLRLKDGDRRNDEGAALGVVLGRQVGFAKFANHVAIEHGLNVALDGVSRAAPVIFEHPAGA
jgi:hypothetical protein